MESEHLIIQNKPTVFKHANLIQVEKLINDNITPTTNFVILPECFNSPYGINYFEIYAEELIINDDNPTIKMLYNISIKYKNVYIIAGTIPEKRKERYFNTCTIWLNGEIIDTYRKIHLFDIDIPGQITFKESDVLTPGYKPTILNTQYGKIGIGICFDLRFNKLSNYYTENDCDIIVYPGSFTQHTGKLHWELLLRARAVDSQCWIIGVSSALNTELDYHSYGNSMVIEPWGNKVSEDIKDNEGIFTIKINPEISTKFKINIPLIKNKKNF